MKNQTEATENVLWMNTTKYLKQIIIMKIKVMYYRPNEVKTN